MPGFGEPVQNNLPALSGLILDLEVAQVKGVGVFDNIDGRNSLNGGGKIATSRCSGFIAIVKDDGNGDVRAYQYIGPDAGNDYLTNEYVSDDDWTNLAYWQEVGGGTGTQGLPGDDGITYTPVVGSVSASTPGSTPVVTVGVATTSATEGVATFNFVLPRGDEGPQGVPGATGNDGTTFTPVIDQVDTLNPGSAATASVNAANGEALFTFGIPAGSVGPQGTQGPQGTAGDDGTTFTPVATATTLEPGAAAYANVISSSANGIATYSFGIPRGETGAQGTAGEVGPTGPAGSISELTNVDADPVASSFLYAPSGTTHLSPHSFASGPGIDITVDGTAVTTSLDFTDVPALGASGGSTVSDIITEGNSGNGFYFVGEDSVQGNRFITFTELLQAIGIAATNDLVDGGYGSIDSYSGETSGEPADLDDDGVVGVGDVLELLSIFGLIVGNQLDPGQLDILRISTLPTDPDTGVFLDFTQNYVAGSKYYIPIFDETGTTTNYHTYSGGPGVLLTTGGNTDGSDSVAFVDSSISPYEVNAANPNFPRQMRVKFFIRSTNGSTVIDAFTSDSAQTDTLILGAEWELQNIDGDALDSGDGSVSLAIDSNGYIMSQGLNFQGIIVDLGFRPQNSAAEAIVIKPYLISSNGVTKIRDTSYSTTELQSKIRVELYF